MYLYYCYCLFIASISPTICVEVNGLNVFVTSSHDLSTLSVMCRVDSVHMTQSENETILTLYKLGFDEIFSSDSTTAIQCFSVDNLPSGGFAYLQQFRVTKTDKVHVHAIVHVLLMLFVIILSIVDC